MCVSLCSPAIAAAAAAAGSAARVFKQARGPAGRAAAVVMKITNYPTVRRPAANKLQEFVRPELIFAKLMLLSVGLNSA